MFALAAPARSLLPARSSQSPALTIADEGPAITTAQSFIRQVPAALNRLGSLSPPMLPWSAEPLARRVWVGVSATLVLLLVVFQNRLARERRSWRKTLLLGEPVLVSDGFGPAVIGVLRPVVVVPRWVLSLDATAQQTILVHELEHRRAGDSRLLLAGLLVPLLLPWNAGLWIIWRRLARAIEYDCDERVLARGVDQAQYASVLLGAWQRARGLPRWVPSPAMAERVSGLGRRVEHLMRPRPRRWRVRAVTGSFVVALCASAAILVPAPRPALGTTPAAGARRPATAQDRPGTILLVGPFDSLGRVVATAVRRGLAADTGGRHLWFVPEPDVTSVLGAAFPSVPSVLSEQHTRELARFMRADLVVAFTLDRSGGDLRLDASIAGVGEDALRHLVAGAVGSVATVSSQVVQAVRRDTTYLRLRRPLP
jgi:beta-lactamase regulating signal transducer with metallopeptidase domain